MKFRRWPCQRVVRGNLSYPAHPTRRAALQLGGMGKVLDVQALWSIAHRACYILMHAHHDYATPRQHSHTGGNTTTPTATQQWWSCACRRRSGSRCSSSSVCRSRRSGCSIQQQQQQLGSSSSGRSGSSNGFDAHCSSSRRSGSSIPCCSGGHGARGSRSGSTSLAARAWGPRQWMQLHQWVQLRPRLLPAAFATTAWLLSTSLCPSGPWSMLWGQLLQALAAWRGWHIGAHPVRPSRRVGAGGRGAHVSGACAAARCAPGLSAVFCASVWAWRMVLPGSMQVRHSPLSGQLCLEGGARALSHGVAVDPTVRSL